MVIFNLNFQISRGNLFSLYPVTLCRHKHLIGKARVRGSVTIFMRTNGFFLFLLSSLLSDMYVLYDSKNFCVWKKFLYFFLKLFIYKRTYIKGFKDNLWLYRSFFILFVKSFVWIIFWISFWMVSKVFPYFQKYLSLALSFV